MNSRAMLDEIIKAWRRPTNWEEFGREVGAILLDAGVTQRDGTPNAPPTEEPPIWETR